MQDIEKNSKQKQMTVSFTLSQLKTVLNKTDVTGHVNYQPHVIFLVSL